MNRKISLFVDLLKNITGRTLTLSFSAIFFSLVWLHCWQPASAQTHDVSPVYKLNIIENNLLSPRSAGDVQSDVITVPNESAPRSAPQNRAPSADGDLDASFNPNASECFGFVEEAIAQPDGKVIIGGLYSGVNGAPRSYLARINADSSLDATFNPGRSGTERDGSRPGSSTER